MCYIATCTLWDRLPGLAKAAVSMAGMEASLPKGPNVASFWAVQCYSPSMSREQVKQKQELNWSSSVVCSLGYTAEVQVALASERACSCSSAMQYADLTTEGSLEPEDVVNGCGPAHCKRLFAILCQPRETKQACLNHLQALLSKVLHVSFLQYVEASISPARVLKVAGLARAATWSRLCPRTS